MHPNRCVISCYICIYITNPVAPEACCCSLGLAVAAFLLLPSGSPCCNLCWLRIWCDGVLCSEHSICYGHQPPSGVWHLPGRPPDNASFTDLCNQIALAQVHFKVALHAAGSTGVSTVQDISQAALYPLRHCCPFPLWLGGLKLLPKLLPMPARLPSSLVLLASSRGDWPNCRLMAACSSPLCSLLRACLSPITAAFINSGAYFLLFLS